jgi:hypothetical protein
VLEKGIWVIKLLIPQRIFRTTEKPEIAATDVWRICGMWKSCRLHASNYDRRFLGIVNFTIDHPNKHLLRDPRTPALIAARVKALRNCIHKILLVILLTLKHRPSSDAFGHKQACCKLPIGDDPYSHRIHLDLTIRLQFDK